MKSAVRVLACVFLLAGATRGQAQTTMQKGQILPSGTLKTESPVTAVGFSPDSSILAGGMTGSIALWNAATGDAMPALRGFNGTVTTLAFSPNSQLLASAGQWDNGEIRIWEVHESRLRATVDHGAPVTALAFSPDGNSLVSSGNNKQIRVWNIGTGAMRARFEGLQFPASAIQWIPNTGLIQSAGGGLGQRRPQENGGAIIDTQGEYAVSSIAGDEIQFQSVLPGGSQFCSFSRDGRTLVMAGSGAQALTDGGAEKVEWNNSQIQMYSVGLSRGDTRPLREPIQIPSRITSLGLASLVWSHDGKRLAWCTPTHVATVDARDPAAQPTILQQDTDAATKTTIISTPGCLAFSPDGQFLIAGDANPAADARHGIQIWGIVR